MAAKATLHKAVINSRRSRSHRQGTKHCGIQLLLPFKIAAVLFGWDPGILSLLSYLLLLSAMFLHVGGISRKTVNQFLLGSFFMPLCFCELLNVFSVFYISPCVFMYSHWEYSENGISFPSMSSTDCGNDNKTSLNPFSTTTYTSFGEQKQPINIHYATTDSTQLFPSLLFCT